MLGSVVGFIVIESREYAMCDLFDDQLIVGLALFALPENAVRMFFHVLYVTLGTTVLLIRKGDGKAGSDFLCGIHIECLIFLKRSPEPWLFLCHKTAIIIAKTSATSQPFARFRSFVFVLATLVLKLLKKPLEA